MKSRDYYDYQTLARSLFTSSDVEDLAGQLAPAYRRLLGGWLPPPREAAIYEVACGPGIMLRYLKAEGYTNVAGSDLAACQVELAKAAGVPVALADSLRELGRQADATWDCVIGIDFVEHLSRDEFVGFLAECRRTLKPGGCLILRLPNGGSPLVGLHLFNDVTHQWTYTACALRALLQMAGFETVAFADETLPSIRHHRWLKVPLARLAQGAIRLVFRAATRESLVYLSPSFFVGAWRK